MLLRRDDMADARLHMINSLKNVQTGPVTNPYLHLRFQLPDMRTKASRAEASQRGWPYGRPAPSRIHKTSTQIRRRVIWGAL